MVLTIISAANLDAITRNLLALSSQYVLNGGHYCWNAMVLVIMIVSMLSIFIFFFTMICNALRIAMYSCSEAIMNESYENLVDGEMNRLE